MAIIVRTSTALRILESFPDEAILRQLFYDRTEAPDGAADRTSEGHNLPIVGPGRIVDIAFKLNWNSFHCALRRIDYGRLKAEEIRSEDLHHDAPVFEDSVRQQAVDAYLPSLRNVKWDGLRCSLLASRLTRRPRSTRADSPPNQTWLRLIELDQQFQ